MILQDFTKNGRLSVVWKVLLPGSAFKTILGLKGCEVFAFLLI